MLSMTRTVAVAVVVSIFSGGLGYADVRSQVGSGSVQTDKLKKPKKHDHLLSSIAIPQDFDRTMHLGYTCIFGSDRIDDDGNFHGAKNVKGNWQTRVYVLDHLTSSFQIFDLDSGTFKTAGDFASDFIHLNLPPAILSAIFVDGFESGDTSAWFVTDVQLKKGRKINAASVSCVLDEFDR